MRFRKLNEHLGASSRSVSTKPERVLRNMDVEEVVVAGVSPTGQSLPELAETWITAEN